MNAAFRPTLIGIELVRGCNFECRMCPVPVLMPEKKFTFMPRDLVEECVAQIKSIQSVRHVYVFNFGEPMAHPDFVELIEYLDRELTPLRKSRGLVVEMFTNGSLLRGPKADVLLRTNLLTSLILSFDGFGDKASFEKMRGPFYDKVIENVNEFGRRARSERPDLILRTNSIVPTSDEIGGSPAKSMTEAKQELSEVFRQSGFEVHTRTLHDYAGDIDLSIKGSSAPAVRGSCHNVESDQVFVSANGKVLPCCSQMNEGLSVGDVRESNLIDIYNGPVMNDLRHMLRTNRRSEVKFCKDCKNGFYEGEFKQNFWLERHQSHPITDASERAAIFEGIDPDRDADELSKLSIKLREAEPTVLAADRRSGSIIGYVDLLEDEGGSVHVEGWAASLENRSPVDGIFGLTQAGELVKPMSVSARMRSGVGAAIGHPHLTRLGFLATFEKASLPKGKISLVALSDGHWSTLSNDRDLTLT